MYNLSEMSIADLTYRLRVLSAAIASTGGEDRPFLMALVSETELYYAELYKRLKVTDETAE